MVKIVRSLFLLVLVVAFSFENSSAQMRVKSSPKRFVAGNVSGAYKSSLSGLPEESFEGQFPPDGWRKITEFGGIGWQQVAVDSSILGFLQPANADAPPGGGDFVVYCSWATGDEDADTKTPQATSQWLITPQITNVQTGDSLIFYLRYFAQFGDNLDIKISTTNADSTGAFDINVATISFSGPGNNAWKKYSYILSNFVTPGSNIYIAFREHVTNTKNNGDALLLDRVGVTSLVTDVASSKNSVPKTFVLEQNYPNPFNPSTQITFALVADSRVTLQVYNLLGQVVATLIKNEFLSAGRHKLQFQAEQLPGGIYFYRLQVSGAFSEVRKMTLLK